MNDAQTRTIRLSRLAIALVASGALLAGCMGGSGDDPDPATAAAAYSVVTTGEVASTIQVTGSITPIRQVALASNLTSAVESLNAKVGQRVSAGELLATMDTTALQRDYDDQVANGARSVVDAQSAVEQAQQQLNDKQQLLNNNLDPQLNGAEQALREADRAYADAQRAYEQRLQRKASGLNADIRSQNLALAQARSQLLSAALNAVRAGLDSTTSALRGVDRSAEIAETQAELAKLQVQLQQADEQEKPAIAAKISAAEAKLDAYANEYPLGIDQAQANAHIGSAEAVNSLNQAVLALNDQQAAVQRTLIDTDRELADLQRAAAQKFDAKKDAAVALETTKMQLQQQINSDQQAIRSAERAKQAAELQARQSTSKLEQQLSDNEVRAPFNGVITSVAAKAGAPVSGPLMTVADDSTLLIRSNVREADLASIHLGDTVQFTSRATGEQRFTGEVSFISPVANAVVTSGKDGGSVTADTSNQSPEFAVEITVTGNRDGLKIGGSVKAEITTESVKGVKTVPRDALVEDGDMSYVLVVNDEGTVEKREVTVGKTSVTDAEITGGDLQAGDVVLNRAISNLAKVGETVDVPDSVRKQQQGDASPATTSSTEANKS
ncbi:HlyD family efflux transporter periplasmic adaptor subunit [Corynebacterium choanae]|uniref:Macrolide export protein MacA n=1 Tax=Corynebacterium choanae TaxID=1862358 RepID=A0A3G6J7H1_9CORY|nr:HlyD family efflux transporter periplasmic adaptor subunit [Corynebacterium choanae]AZA13936.1 Macrolide export protein MacA [Corynebacterium choanae]